ncbi:TetR/AcrR family transcriptional regulator [Streptomyces sp. Li-HN-5-11]|uniref:TetR/AcrR family transcriptional regulator n=1 Tax=Streptomyces sp. Li-HN-5-11 TaxID=3075432 RepID=UPI0028AB6B7D|nr:TetR/AcrR family transcriptional regulator [Streptomyces sp. Li-HN-5-11]WNM34756.1 TetR/AcrR family transcriptional regulator [Streptomyces sp. Li-HN-5-11]
MTTPRSTRAQILDAAEHLFGARGYADVTINQICEASGLPVGSVYHHFGSKAGVLQAVLERGTREFFEAVPTIDDLTGSPWERLAVYFETAGDLVDKQVSFFRLLASLRLHQAENEEIRAAVRQEEERAISWCMSFIEPVAASCGVRDSAECARELAILSLVFLTGLVASADSTGMDIRTGISRHLHRLVVASIRDRAVELPTDR